MNYNKLNNLTGWIIFAIATLVYVLTLEPTASYWDCGEFISCANKLMIPHPPGAPFFLLIGRFFSFMAGNDQTMIAYWVNVVSALSSSFTVLFLFWSISLLAKKVVQFEKEPSLGQSILILGSAAVGSLAYTFTDSAWFSAVEAEVYAMSSFFTAFLFWAILKWEARSEETDSDKWIILIAYMMGLSIGVHLLNLVAIPALAFVYYFKKYPTNAKGTIITLLISAVIIMIIMVGIIPGLPTLAGKLEVLFVNKLGLPFGSGIIFFIILLVAALSFGIYYSIINKKRLLNTSLICITFILIGYASYGIIVVRTTYDPTIDMNDPEDIMSLVSYLNREQYGDRPLLKGPYFTADYPTSKEGSPIYRKGKKKYEIYDHKREIIYKDKDLTLFPRAYSTQSHHIRAYREWMNLPKGKPTMADNMEFMFKYQIGHMYWRYFMWNFAGRESDIQNASWIGPRDWGNDEELPYNIKTNKARNNFYMLPLLAGVVGMFFHFRRNAKDATIVAILFFFTGIAIILYLNQPPVEPRERDYTFAASFWAFSIWIGMAVMFLADALSKMIKSETARATVATTICFLVPAILAAEGWDDHDRSKRYHSVDSAKNLLNSCAPNAILFTGGDNDTYPLWYVQEVEGFRTDVRVCNLSLLNTDWYISQMKRKSYKSDPLPISLPLEVYLQGTNDQVYLKENPKALNLRSFIKLIGTDDPAVQMKISAKEKINYFPSKKLQLDIDKKRLQDSSFIPENFKPYILDKLAWTITTGEVIDKKTLIMLDMLVTNNWERPIYFATTISPSEFLNLKEFTQLEGMAYRLLPIKVPGSTQGWVNTEIMYKNMMNDFHWRNLDNPNVYYNEWYFSFTTSERLQFFILADQLYKEGKNDKAKAALLQSLKVMPDTSLTFDEAIASYVPLLFSLGEDKKAQEIIDIMGPRIEVALRYAAKYKDMREMQSNLMTLQQFFTALKDQEKNEEAKKYEELFEEYFKIFRGYRENN
jgi:hypothetical protein